jgi:hypothetical protein
MMMTISTYATAAAAAKTHCPWRVRRWDRDLDYRNSQARRQKLRIVEAANKLERNRTTRLPCLLETQRPLMLHFF